MSEGAFKRSRAWVHLLNVAGPFFGLLLVIGLFSLDSEVRETFLTGPNFKFILTQTVVVAICALGMTMIIVSGGIDLSLGSVVALTSVLGAKLMEQFPGMSAVWVTLITLMTGGLIGLTNGTAIASLRLMPFIVTLGMMGIARGAAKWLAANQTVIYDENAPLNDLMAVEDPLHFFPLPTGVWTTVILAGVMVLVMRQTIFGRYVFAIGSNEATARLCGIRVGVTKVAIYGLAGMFFGLAGLMQMSRLTIGDPSASVGLELDVIAAVVIGGASLSGGTGSIMGSMIGAMIMAVLRAGAGQMAWPNYVQEIIIGGVIILAVALDKFRQHRSPA